MAVDLKNYSVNLPKLEMSKDFNDADDIRMTAEFNKRMAEIRKEFSAKEKRSFISAKKVVLTD